MHRQRPDLIVPIRDRRRHRRVLTLRNLGYTMLALVVAFLAITIRSEFRRGPAEGDYGRLYDRQLPPPPQTETRPVEIVEEAKPVGDEVSADPMLVQPAVRGQWIETPPPAPPLTGTREGNSRVAIVGGPEGVTTIGDAPQREVPKLKGGIFRAN